MSRLDRMLEVLERLAPVAVATAAVGALVVSVYTAIQVNTVHISINSRMDQLLSLTESASRAEGLKAGRAEKR